MKLQRTLFYVMLVVLIIALMMIIYVDPNTVLSRIATGFITGSVIGISSAIVNYLHQKQVFFEKLTDTLFKIVSKMQDYASEAKIYNESLAEHSKDYNIQQAFKQEDTEEKEQLAMKEECEALYNQIDFDAYQPFFFYHPLKKTLLRLEDFAFEFCNLHGQRLMCRALGLLAVESPKEIQMLVIGDPDEFYDDTIQRNKDYYDLICWSLYQVSIITADIVKILKLSSMKHVKTMFNMISSYAVLRVDKSSLRDVRREWDEQLDKEWEERAE